MRMQVQTVRANTGHLFRIERIVRISESDPCRRLYSIELSRRASSQEIRVPGLAWTLPEDALKSAKMCAKDAKKCAKDAKKCAGVCGDLGVLGVLEKLDAQFPVQKMIMPFS